MAMASTVIVMVQGFHVFGKGIEQRQLLLGNGLG